MNKEEKINYNKIKSLLDNCCNIKLQYEIVPLGCHIVVKCLNTETLSIIDELMHDYLVEQQLDSIRGSITVTYSHLIKK